MRPVVRDLCTVVGVALASVAYGCPPTAEGPQLAPACTAPEGRIARASRASIIDWANRVTYLPSGSTGAYVYGFAAGDSVRIEAADNRAGRGCIVARLTSRTAYPAMGIGAGRSYVLVDSVSGRYRAVIIAENASVPMTVLPVALHTHVLGAPAPEPVSLLGGCVPGCGSGGRYWCRFPGDTTRTQSILSPEQLDRLPSGGLR